MEASTPRLPPRMNGELRRIVESADVLLELLRGFGSPLNVVFPAATTANAAALQQLLEGAHVPHRIFFAHKANRSAAIVRQLAAADVGVDVASHGELCAALSNGVPAARIGASGPKNHAYLRLALQHGVQIAVDSVAEVHALAELHAALRIPRPAPVLLRLSGFTRNGRPMIRGDDKFGIPVPAVPAALALLQTLTTHLRLRGFAFHLAAANAVLRAQAAEQCLELLFAAQDQGFAADVLNVGGGFKVSYVDGAENWHNFVSALKASVLGDRPPLTWNGAGLGMSASGGVLTGAAHLRELYREDVAGTELRDFLGYRTSIDGGIPLGTLLSDNQIELQLEPGRALLDQAGLTLGRVTAVKSSVQGKTLVGVDMNRTNLEMTDEEVFTDPVVIPAGAGGTAPVPVYLSGNLCLPGDLIYRHRTVLDRLPAAGDALVFVNSAAYAMDFFQSETAGQAIAPKVAMWIDDGGRPRWCVDSQYEPQRESGGMP